MSEPRVVVERQPVVIDTLLTAIAAAAERTGEEAYLVGGFVRDRLLGREGKDIDILTVGGDADASDILRQVAESFGWARPQLFERFGTGQARGDGWVVEVVQARAERYDPTSRRPEVRPGTLDEDIWRRDFTVNALCQTFTGTVLDRTGRGLDDLVAGVLRTPLDPHETFSEDPLRMFRAARFVSQLGFTLAPGVIEAIRDQADRAAILSVERIRDELRRLLTGDHPSRGIEVLHQGGLLDAVLPEVAAMVGVEQSGYHTHDVYWHTLLAVDAAPADLVTRTAVLLHDVGKPPCHAVDATGRHTFHEHPSVGAAMATEILERLRFSNQEISDVADLVRLHLRPIQYRAETHSDSAVRRLIRDAGPLRDRMLEVARADTRASSFPDTDAIEELAERMAQLDSDGGVSRFRPPLDGHQIMKLAGGRKHGPWIGVAQRALEEAVLDGHLPAGDTEAARRWLLEKRPDLLREG